MLVDKLADEIQAKVLSGELPSGTRLRQETLAEQFGVSRTPVREALRKLQASGLVELQPHRGALVRRHSPREIRDAYEVRAELEALAAGLAAERIRPEQLDRLHEAQEHFEHALELTVSARKRKRGNGVTDHGSSLWGRANDEFHSVISEASGNEALSGALRHLHRSLPRDLSRVVLSENTTLLHDNVGEHRAILDAIESRDASGARDLMHRHVKHAGALVTLRFEQLQS